MTIDFHDIAGALGVALIVGAYFLLQTGRLRGTSLTFSSVNAVGAALILFSLIFEFNLAAFLVEFFWLVISLIGIGRYFRDRGEQRAAKD